MRIAVDLVVWSTTAAYTEAVQRGLNPGSPSVSDPNFGTERNRGHAQLYKTCPPPAEGTLSPIRIAHVELPSSIAGIQVKLTRVDAASDLERTENALKPRRSIRKRGICKVPGSTIRHTLSRGRQR